MLKTIFKYVLTTLLTVTLVACKDDGPLLKVGSKPFAESEILAEMIAQLAENEGIKVERNIPYGTTNRVLQAAKEGHVDIYPDYNGTSLIFLGQAPTSDSSKSTETVNKLFKPQGLEMGASFGFSNDYVLAMTAERAAELGVSKISDLAGLSTPLTYAVDDDFLQRPADGLQQMNRRYGITGSRNVAFPLGSDGKDQIISAILDGTADVAELYATDGQIAEYSLVVLDDDQNFFPVYDAAPLLRSDALSRIPALGGVLDKLTGAISAADMQSMNKAVDLDAQTPASVASAFLESKGLLPEGSGGGGADTLLVAVDPSVNSSSTTAKALRAIRAGYSGSNLELSKTESPLAAISEGTARVAMVGAETFYELGDSGPIAKNTAEAFAVLGYKSAHLIGLRGASKSISDMKKIATGPIGSSSANVLDMILSSLGSSEGIEVTNSDASVADQITGLVNGQYDGVFIMAPQGDSEVSAALVNAAVGLISLNEWAEGGHTANFSFIRPATIPARTYNAQYQPVASISTQVVLAGPVERIHDAGEVGPGTTGTGDTGVAPISNEAVSAIRKAIGDSDVIDPAVPVHASLVPSIEVVDKSLPFSADISIMNILVILFLIWMVYICLLPSPRKFTLPEDGE